MSVDVAPVALTTEGEMRIGGLAREVGVSPRALRYYEEQGLLRSERTDGGQRIYSESAIERVRLIQSLYRASLTSRTVVSILPCLDTGAINREQLSTLLHEQARISAQIQELKQAHIRLTNLIESAEVVDQAA